MAIITLQGNETSTSGNPPETGSRAPDFRLTRSDMTDVGLFDFSGRILILNVVPSLDTGVCATSARTFNKRAAELPNTVILTVSRDLPFAQKRFCEAEGIDTVITLSELRNRDFGRAYGLEITNGPLAGLLARAVLVLDRSGLIIYSELVPEIAHEPDYESALAAAKAAG